ncbi:alpha-galactosidase [Olivibacter sp. SDN3]|uniref:alpha-galactosidase n=1 Tax=Olivibacter sp. SDN3 TaxID=2764720 RepID=UPI001650E718|nr:alpha-galactosidase [Olivibacter sp. SDN3]QNL49561.1 alpha-galactosidase [Olivibacter sp. SDN3]
MKKTFFLLFTVVFGYMSLYAQQQQLELKTEQQIVLETQHQALVLQVEENKDFNMAYLGPKLQDKQEYQLLQGMYQQTGDYTGMYAAAYTGSGARNLLEPAISVIHTDGNQSLDLKYVRHELQQIDQNITELKVDLRDAVYPFEVRLYYRVYAAEDVMEQWAVIQHQEKGPVELTKYASANLSLKADDFWLRHYHGDWITEMQPEETKLTHGIKTIDSKLGARTNLFQPSAFMLSFGHPSKENEGTVLFGGLEWSGNFKIDFELDPQDNLRILAGMNNYASTYVLKAQEDFITPKFLYTLSNEGMGKASRNLHNWARNYKLLDGKGERLTLLNNWEATYFDFNENKLFALLKDTKKLGVDLFLLDDGWFGNKYPRNADTSALGDWEENKEKLPNGLISLVKEASNNEVKFGIWVEPEMVSPKSELYEKHPDWVVKQAERPEYYFRNQLVLDLSNPEVQNFVFKTLDDLFVKNPGLAYVKWDCNAVIYNAHSPYLKEQGNFYVDYVRGLYKVLERFREKYPKVPMMLCSGGGGRVDYGSLEYFTEYWPSDNTDPLERIFMQYEYSYFYPAIASSNHVTDWGKQSMKFKVDVAMMGKLGFDIVVSELPEEELAFCQEAIKNYNELKPTIWQGDQYRLADPRSQDYASICYVNEERSEGVMFNYQVNYRQNKGSIVPIKLQGLDPQKQYRLEEINLYKQSQSPINSQELYSGEFLMKVGFNPQLDNNRTSVVLKISESR